MSALTPSTQLALRALACQLVISVAKGKEGQDEAQVLMNAVLLGEGPDALAQLAVEAADIARSAFDRHLDRDIWVGALRDEMARCELAGDLEEFDGRL
ncbi:hypothetical protein [Curtobacterium sp. MCBA15_001]|uniref:hypothetical protein n=1 Tax=Curtobacterium sp. MCBA15_001 TaxID=1898731 RepID=UPI0008DDC55B|nr:hypothetical protein [Curtobacterium sp. MCBA15_001]OIH95109.1 hypothetical protein BIU90_02935 [Curtobacterium sp. MCBA15_001]